MKEMPYIEIYDSVYNEAYKLSAKNKIEIYVPKTGMEIPKQSDYDRGYYYRYFYRLSSNTDGIVYEIKESEYKKLQKEKIYKTLKIKWKLIGPKEVAKKINTNIINSASEILKSIKSTLIDPLQFWKNLPDVVSEFDVTNSILK